MLIELQRRPTPSQVMQYASPVIAVVAMILIGFVLCIVSGRDPVATLYTFAVSPVKSLYGVGELAIKAAPLVLIAIGLAIGFQSNVWNIGAEGQLTIGAIFSGGLALHFGSDGGSMLLPAMIVAGGVGGMLWAAIPALLRSRFNASEILVSLMLNYVAQLLLSYLVYGPWRDPAGFNFPQSEPLAPEALYPILVANTRLNAGVFIALAAVVLGWVLMKRSFLGFQLKVSGLAEPAARYAGFSAAQAIWVGMLAGGLAAGVAGVGEVAGPLGQLFPTASPGYGYAAIIVAFLGRLNPFGILIAGLFMSLLYLGGEAAQIELNLPSATTGLFQGALLFLLLATDVLINYRVVIARPRTLREGAR
jgi:general nucleoside transport system permease protein